MAKTGVQGYNLSFVFDHDRIRIRQGETSFYMLAHQPDQFEHSIPCYGIFRLEFFGNGFVVKFGTDKGCNFRPEFSYILSHLKRHRNFFACPARNLA